MLRIGERVPLLLVRQFSTAADLYPSKLVDHLREAIVDYESTEFLQGVLSGIAFAAAAVQQGKPDVVGQACAVLANHLERRE